MEIALGIIVICGLILYFSWINNSLRDMKEKLSSIEKLLQDKKD
jgi:hypothetical protein